MKDGWGSRSATCASVTNQFQVQSIGPADESAQGEDQKVVHTVASDEAVSSNQMVPGSRSFLDDDFAADAVVGAISFAINDSHACSQLQCWAQMLQQCNGISNLMVSLQQQHGINRRLRQHGVIALAQNGFYVGQGLATLSVLDVANRFGIYVHRVHSSGETHPPCSPYGKPA